MNTVSCLSLNSDALSTLSTLLNQITGLATHLSIHEYARSLDEGYYP